MITGKLIGHGVYEYTNRDEAIKDSEHIQQRDPVYVAEFRPCQGTPRYFIATKASIQRWSLGSIINVDQGATIAS
jgi:hypothetical protein